MPSSVLLVISYILLAIFIAAFLVRALRLARMPVHLRWELAPVPHEKGRGKYGGSYLEEYEWWKKPREKSMVNELAYMLQEIIFLKALWEHRRSLWVSSFPFHFGMYVLTVVMAVLVLAGILELTSASIASPAWLQSAIKVLAIVGYLLGLFGAVGLLLTRLTSPRLKPFTSPVALFNLVLLAAVFATGGWAVLAGDYVSQAAGFVGSLLTAEFSATVPIPLALHVLLVGVFLAYLPFSQMMHFVAKYFTYHQVRWNDEPLERGSRMEKEVLGLLTQPVTWSAPHLNADGKKNWVDIATEETSK